MSRQRGSTFFVKGEKIVLRKDATWIADGIEITHEPTRELFYKAVQWDATEKKYCLKVGYETMYIEVEDTAWFVTSISESTQPVAKLSNGAEREVAAGDLEYKGGALYLKLADGQRARFLSAPYHDLLARKLEQDESYYYVVIAGKRVNLSPKNHST